MKFFTAQEIIEILETRCMGLGSQHDAAQLMKISEANISATLNGKRKRIGKKILNALGFEEAAPMYRRIKNDS
jgi:transcriptional regulator